MNYSIFEHLNVTELSGFAFKEHAHKKKIIAHLSNLKESTIPQIADLLNISIPKANELISSLLEEGLINEAGQKSEGLGRKAAAFTLNPGSCYFLGVEIRKYKINLGLMGFDKTIAASSIGIPFPFPDPHESLNEIIKSINEFIESSAIPKDKIIGMGLSMAGRVNVKTGEIITIYHFEDAPLKKILEEAIELPVYIDNDSRTIAYGEYYFGKLVKEKNAIVVNLDYGLGTGIFIDGKPLYGASGYAGELGHIPLFDNEKICFCGKKGCMETEASGGALIARLIEKMEAGSNSHLKKIIAKKGFIELEDVIEAVHKDDNLAIETVSEIATCLGKGLAVAINLFNPSIIILGGILSKIGNPFLLPVQSAIFQYSLSRVNADTKINISQIHEKAGLLGCCLLVRDKTLDLL